MLIVQLQFLYIAINLTKVFYLLENCLLDSAGYDTSHLYFIYLIFCMCLSSIYRVS